MKNDRQKRTIMNDEDTFTIEKAYCTYDSGKALKIHAECFDEPVWVPHSQIHDNSEVFQKEDSGNLVVTMWFAEQRSWV